MVGNRPVNEFSNKCIERGMPDPPHGVSLFSLQGGIHVCARARVRACARVLGRVVGGEGFGVKGEREERPTCWSTRSVMGKTAGGGPKPAPPPTSRPPCRAWGAALSPLDLDGCRGVVHFEAALGEVEAIVQPAEAIGPGATSRAPCRR